MPLILSKRNTTLTEWMEKPDCDPKLLSNTYRQFGKINRLLSGWDKIYERHIKPVIQRLNGSATLLDIGCGGGDIIRFLDKQCRKDGFNVMFTGIDPDQRAVTFQEKLGENNRISFRKMHSRDLSKNGEHFDLVISNHLIHHLTEDQLYQLCSDAETIARHKVIFSDIERSDIGFAAFAVFAPLLFQNSYIVKDGLISIRRSFRKEELQNRLPDGWNVKRSFPFRLIATYELVQV